MYGVRNVYSAEAWSDWENGDKLTRLDDTGDDARIRFDAVRTFDELTKRVGFLQLMNKRHVLYFRGLSRDYPEDLPSIFRELHPTTGADQLRERMDLLRRQAEVWRSFLAQPEVHPRPNTLKHYPETIWAIQQHYKDVLVGAGVSSAAASPYLDVTQSLRVAATFATRRRKDAATSKGKPAILKVIALPQTTGSITYSADEQLQMLRLSALSPPGARRPLVQEGHLVARFPLPSDDEMCAWWHERKLSKYMSLRRRIVAVIPITPEDDGTFSNFWGDFGTPPEALLRCPWFEGHRGDLGRRLEAASSKAASKAESTSS